MIHITGDTHGTRDWGKIFMAYRNRKISSGDYLIITGDFGAIWNGNGKDDEILNRYEKLPFTILFIDGNHENFDVLNSYPVEMWNGGKIHKIRNNIIHLMRGQVFTIENKTFFTMGGGTSIDKEWRLQWKYEQNQYLKRGKSPKKIWWEQELPTEDEILEAKKNLSANQNRVDYILTHTQSNLFMERQLQFIKENSILTNFLDYVVENVQYKRWFCGHFHVDREYDAFKVSILYENIVFIN